MNKPAVKHRNLSAHPRQFSRRIIQSNVIAFGSASSVQKSKRTDQNPLPGKSAAMHSSLTAAITAIRSNRRLPKRYNRNSQVGHDEHGFLPAFWKASGFSCLPHSTRFTFCPASRAGMKSHNHPVGRITADEQLDSSVTPVALLVFQNSFEEVFSAKVWPESRSYIDLGIGDLP